MGLMLGTHSIFDLKGPEHCANIKSLFSKQPKSMSQISGFIILSS